jgi:hypothetical protein
MTKIKSKPATNKAPPKPLTMRVGDGEIRVSPELYAYDQIMSILDDDKQRMADLARDQVIAFGDRIKASGAKTLSAGVLAALGMGPPKRQGGRATILEIEDQDQGPSELPPR